MTKNKIKKSSDSLFLLGFLPVVFLVFFFVIFIITALSYGNKSDKAIVENPKVIHDTIYIECKKTHCDHPVIEEKPLRKKIETIVVEEPKEKEITESDSGSTK